MKVGLPGLLFLVFLVLKLTGVIAWSWLWVLAPLWIPFGIWAIILILAYGLGVFIRKTETPGDRAARALRNYGKGLK